MRGRALTILPSCCCPVHSHFVLHEYVVLLLLRSCLTFPHMFDPQFHTHNYVVENHKNPKPEIVENIGADVTLSPLRPRSLSPNLAYGELAPAAAVL